MTAVVPIQSAKPAAGITPQRVGVLLVNLGTPDSADANGVRVYLKEFLSDPRVIENQGLLWKLALNGVILRTRPARKARDYQKIWNTEKNESPLKTITRAQSDKLAASIADHDHVVVDWAMRYGNPSIRAGIDALTAQGCDRLLVVPLYPQYSAATSATVCDEVFRVLDVPDAVRMQLCVGTSIAIILPTTVRSYITHREKGLVIPRVIRLWALPAVIGVSCGAVIAAFAPPEPGVAGRIVSPTSFSRTRSASASIPPGVDSVSPTTPASIRRAPKIVPVNPAAIRTKASRRFMEWRLRGCSSSARSPHGRQPGP